MVLLANLRQRIKLAENSRGPGGRIADLLVELWKVAAFRISLRMAGRAKAGEAATDRDARAVCLRSVGRMSEAIVMIC